MFEAAVETERLNLLLDADDTLWENNIYFLEVTEALVDALSQYGIEPDHARSALLEIEGRNIEHHGYGSRSFALSVVEAYQVLSAESDAATEMRLRRLAEAIFEREEMELRPQVREVLETLRRHHRLILVTKGDPEEQERKLERSGLREHFEWVEVVDEKNVDTYLGLVRRLHLNPVSTWMIGNSPKSDINPAIAAGLRAVLIPHPQTWELEIEDIEHSSDKVVVVDSLADLVELFVRHNS